MEDQFLSCVPTSIRVEQMQLVRNLVDVKIAEEQLASANFTGGIKIQVRCEKPFTINSFWIVNIEALHRDIEKDWRTMRDELWDNTFLSNVPGDNYRKCLMRGAPDIHQESNEQITVSVKPPQPIDTSTMTQTPREFYPLVIVVSCHEEEPGVVGTSAAANIHIVHIKDDVVPIKSHVIKQYTKQLDGRILDISRLYAEETTACFICFEEADPNEGLKLFCLLPCRHSPICSNCIGRIRECPKCRSPIASIFDINSPNSEVGNETESPNRTIDPNLRHLYDDNEDDRSGRRRGFLGSLRSMFGL